MAWEITGLAVSSMPQLGPGQLSEIDTMSELNIKTNYLGFELYDGDKLVTLYRATEELPQEESPKPCFHPIYTPSGKLITEYRPKDHVWHTGLYYGWVHVNTSNLWGGPWYLKEIGRYATYADTHGTQAHESFEILSGEGSIPKVVEQVTWRDATGEVMARDERTFEFSKLKNRPGTRWRIKSVIASEVETLALGASRAARYSGLELRMGPPFSPASHRSSEGTEGHESIMKSNARWCCAVGECGGAVVMLDHPANPRHPTNWFTRANLMGAGLLMEEDLTVEKGEVLTLQYGFLVLDEDPGDEYLEAQWEGYVKCDA